MKQNTKIVMFSQTMTSQKAPKIDSKVLLNKNTDANLLGKFFRSLLDNNNYNGKTTVNTITTIRLSQHHQPTIHRQSHPLTQQKKIL